MKLGSLTILHPKLSTLRLALLVFLVSSVAPTAARLRAQDFSSRRIPKAWESGEFRWNVSQPILAVSQELLPKTSDAWIAVKDPSVVRYQDRWHLFCTLRKQKTGQGRIRIGYCSFANWSDAKRLDGTSWI